MGKNGISLLSACTKGGRAKIVKINASGPLKQRLISFGLMKGSEVTMLECALNNSTYEIKVGNVSLALRREEAELIEVDDVQ